MNHRKKIVFLYFELAGYFMACIERLVKLYNVEIHIVRYPVNAVAPFQFEFNENINFYELKDYNRQSLTELTHQINPDLLYICGWSNKDYVAVAKSFHKQIPVVLTFDNPWLGTIKQHLASLFGGFFLKNIYTHCWVPGDPNAKYARKLGFKGEHLVQGMYSADYDLFHNYYLEFAEPKKRMFPKRFIFVGRYTALKGVREMWEAFIQLQNEMPNEWEFWCLGKGELDSEFPSHPRIKNFGFVQPVELKKYIEQTGVFILPAHYEHWGVVVHEFAAAGFPLLCTTTTSAATAFLKDSYNGFMIDPKSTEAIKNAFKKIVSLNDEELNQMAERSVELSHVITPTTWSQTLIGLLN